LKESPLRNQQKAYARRKKSLRRLLALILVSTVALVMLAFWATMHRKTSVINHPANLPQNLAQRASGYTVSRSEQGRELFTIHAARTLSYNEGSNRVLEDVHVVIFGRNGERHDEIHAERCFYDAVTGSLACPGKAEITLPSPTPAGAAQRVSQNPPVVVHTSDVSYNSRQFLVKTNSAVRFQYGLDSGAAIGLAYDTQRGWLDLRKDVAFDLQPKADSEVPVRVTAGGLRYLKQSGRLTLRAPVRISQGDRYLAGSAGLLDLDARGRATGVALMGGVEGFARSAGGTIHGTAENAIASLNPETSQLQKLEASGSVRLIVQGLQKSTRSLSAQHVVLTFSGQKAQPEAGLANGNVRLDYRPLVDQSSSKSHMLHAGNPSRKILTTNQLKFHFRPDGVIASAATLGRGTIRVLPEAGAAARQTITAGKFLMAFDSKGRLGVVRGLAGSRIVSQPGFGTHEGAGSQITTGERLQAVLDPLTGTLTTIRQAGNFQFRQADRRASAETGQYSAGNQMLTLEGLPLIWDVDARIQAPHFRINLAEGEATGWGGVESIYFGHEGHDGTKGDPAVAFRTQAGAIPLIVQADQVIATRATQFAHYQGNVRAWYGSDMIESPSLDIYKRPEIVRSGAGVLSSFVQQGAFGRSSRSKPPRSEKRPQQLLTIRADRLIYFQVGERAIYRGNVQAQSENTSLRADRLEVDFSSVTVDGQPAVERVVADGDVKAVQVSGRRASGEHAVYFTRSGEIVLTGGPPVIYDAKQGFVTGHRLTFFTRDASLIADGGPRAPAVVKYHVSHQ
jgi:lipopolysaccharide export system protein LptA